MSPGRSLPIALACCVAVVARGQDRTALRLNPVPATHPAEFSSIAVVRELGDGRVIVLDTTEKRLLVADFRSGTAQQLGRTGDGPEEYRRPNGLFPLLNDSTLVVDATGRRWILLAGDRPVETIGPQSPVIVRDGAGGFVRGVDVTGRVVMSVTPRLPGRPVDQGDSLYLARFSRMTGQGDTVARLRSPYGGPPGSATSATPRMLPRYQLGLRRELMLAQLVGDQAIAFVDGWIAVARVEPYRVDWIDTAGKMHYGKPLAAAATVLDDREKRFYLARMAERDGRPAGPPSDIKNWRADIPPFWGTSSVFAAPGGVLVIARAQTSVLPNSTYDVVDRSGVYRGQLSLSATERIVGFGVRSVYLSTVDSDGIERLRRHPWP